MILSYFCSYHYCSTSEGLSYKVGEILGTSFGLFVFLCLPLQKFRKKYPLFPLIFFFITIYQCGKMHVEYLHLKNAKKEMVELFSNENIVNSCEEIADNYSKGEYGEFAPLLNGMRYVFKDRNKEWTDYNQLIENLRFNEVLKAKFLCDELQRSISRDKIRLLNQKVDELDENYIENIKKLKEYLRFAEFSEEKYRRSVLKGLDEGLSKTAPMWNEFCEVERSFFMEIEALLDFMDDIGGVYSESNGLIIFEHEYDLSIYNQHIDNIMKIANQEEDILRKINEYQNKVMEDFKKLS